MNFTEAMTALCGGYTIQRSDWSYNEYIEFTPDKIYKYVGSEKFEYEFSEFDLVSKWIKYNWKNDSWEEDSWEEDSWNDGY